ncbi:hypothetical protein FA13DRAFT_1712398 [Coprinellus micaceus]|uniref:Uncharacterized protein n=1 Tax=Coprinellus micaceus TaxID=71717 RepID=A0A4Y7T0L1_COPMI|nr:hypothetical protein FA13DRAFT_1712398 [Coprinellus micaceus]
MSATDVKTSYWRPNPTPNRARRPKARQHAKHDGRIEQPIERTTLAKEDHRRFSQPLAHSSATKASDGHDAFRSPELAWSGEAPHHTSSVPHTLQLPLQLSVEPPLASELDTAMSDAWPLGPPPSNSCVPYPYPSPSVHSAGAQLPDASGIELDPGLDSFSSSPSTSGYVTASSTPPLPALLTTSPQLSIVDRGCATSSYPWSFAPSSDAAWSDTDFTGSTSSLSSPEMCDPGTLSSAPCPIARSASKSPMALSDWGKPEDGKVGPMPGHRGKSRKRSFTDFQDFDDMPTHYSADARPSSPWRSPPPANAPPSTEGAVPLSGFCVAGPSDGSTSSLAEREADSSSTSTELAIQSVASRPLSPSERAGCSSSTTELVIRGVASSLLVSNTPGSSYVAESRGKEEAYEDVVRRLGATSVGIDASYHRIGCHLVAVLDLVEELVALDRLKQELTSKLLSHQQADAKQRSRTHLPTALRHGRIATQGNYPRSPTSTSLSIRSDQEIKVMGRQFSVNPASLGPEIARRWAAPLQS